MQTSAFYESTKAGFAQYRALGKGHHYPVALKQAALKLLADYPARQLADALGITPPTLRNWQHQSNLIPAPAHSTEFVTLTLKDTSTLPSTSFVPLALTLNLPQGLNLAIPAQPVNATAQLIHALIKEMAACSI